MELTPHDRYQHVVYLIVQQRKLFLSLGKELKDIKEGKLYKEMGEGGYETWDQFLASPEIDLRRSTADMYIKVYSFYIEKMKLPEEEVLQIPVGRLNLMSAKLESLPEDQRKEFIAKAITLGYTDFQQEARLAPQKRKINIYHCEKCEKLVIEYDPKEICMCNGKPDIKTYE